MDARRGRIAPIERERSTWSGLRLPRSPAPAERSERTGHLGGMKSNRDSASSSGPLGAIATVQKAAAVAVATGIPTILWGEPGIGKSAWTRSFAERHGIHLETVIASIREPTDFSGLPVVSPEGTVRLAAPDWAARLVDNGNGLLFLDEVSTAAPAVQAALLRVVLDRVLGDVVLPERVKILAAANPAESASGGWDLTPPLANRFCHLHWPVDAAGIAQGFLSGWSEPEIMLVPVGWTEEVRLHQAIIGAFLERMPGNAHARPAERSRSGMAWPSPRTWTYAARLMAACAAIDVGTEVCDLLVAGCVGDGAGAELSHWLEDQDLPDPKKVLADPQGFAVPDRGDRAYTLARSVVAIATTGSRASKRTWEAAWRVLERIAVTTGADVVVPPASDLARCSTYQTYAPPAEAGSLFSTMRAAGML